MAKTRKKMNGEAAPDATPDAAPQSFGDTTAGTPDRDRIAMRAYEIYLARGGNDGMALEDWLEAERELTDPDGPRTSE